MNPPTAQGIVIVVMSFSFIVDPEWEKNVVVGGELDNERHSLATSVNSNLVSFGFALKLCVGNAA